MGQSVTKPQILYLLFEPLLMLPFSQMFDECGLAYQGHHNNPLPPPLGLGEYIWMHLVNGMGNSSFLGQPTSGSQTGQVIQGLRSHNQNTFGPTEGRNVQWREANRRCQRQANQHHGLVPTPPPPYGPPLYATPSPITNPSLAHLGNGCPHCPVDSDLPRPPPLAQARPRSQKTRQNSGSTPTPCLNKAVLACGTYDGKHT